MTGYLTQRGRADGNLYNLVIPNREIRNIFTEQIMKMFQEQAEQDGDLEAECQKALTQMRALYYEEGMRSAGMRKILKHGIVCWKKTCKVVVESESLV